MEYIQVSTTTDSKEGAERIARRVVEERLAACVQITGPVKSIYWWKGVMEEAEEWLLVMKTVKGIYLKVEEEIRRIHPYETPEIVAVPIVEGSMAYLDWIGAETGTGSNI
jgi:periplasmic divalent cation tolerance protein